MINKFFNFTMVGGTTEIPSIIKAGISLNDVIHYIYEDGKLFIMMREQREELQPLQVPILKNSKVSQELQIRNVKDFFTIKIENLDDIERFLKLIE